MLLENKLLATISCNFSLTKKISFDSEWKHLSNLH